jgi:hypothetical protein
MSAIRAIHLLACVAACLAAPFASAQAPSSSRAAGAEATASGVAASSLVCLAKSGLEVAPVSFDALGKATAWVLVHRVKDEIVASERIGAQEILELRQLRCDPPSEPSQGLALVG